MQKLIVVTALVLASPAVAQQSSDRSFIFCTKPNMIVVGDKCVDVGTTGGTTVLPSTPTCPNNYALLAYPGTWTLVCARDLQVPK